MKKLLLVIAFLLAAAALGWQLFAPKPSADAFSLASIRIGDNLQTVETALGSEYTKEEANDPGHFSEPYSVLKYHEGISVLVGNNSKKVLQIITTSDQYQTGLGATVGDNIAKVKDSYQEYPIPKSNQGDELLDGWFVNKSGQVIIFDSNLADNSTFSPVKPGAKVEQIIITNWEYID